MTQAAKAQEPSMEEILASIRRIIADDEGGKPAAAVPSGEKAAAPVRPVPPPGAESPRSEPAAATQSEIDTMLAEFEEPNGETGIKAKASAERAQDNAAEVLELTEAMRVSPSPAANFQTVEPNADVVFADPPPERSAPPPSPPPRAEDASGLMSERATAAVGAAFSSLAHTVLMQNARTLDDLVRDMLRPMLKSWLDENLPAIVERLVRAEIERVSRGRG
ncbi:MAG TPA: DUF2497 domain-containing protein [Xanthobacteraceae bacterium]|nr:DUF2497 domain-containing protein [Xanthobacteraceae bacterium]